MRSNEVVFPVGGGNATSTQATVARGTLVALLLLCLTNLCNYYDRMLIIVMSQPVREEFKLSDTQYGILTGPAFVVVYSLSGLVFGWLADRHSRRTILASAVMLWSVMTAFCGLARDFPMLALARAGIGIGEGGINPTTTSLLADYFPPARRSMAISLFFACGMVGMLLSFMVGSWISVHFGWRSAFFIAGIPGIVLAAVFLFAVREPVRGQYDAARVVTVSYREQLVSLVRNRPYRWLTMAAGFATFANLGMLIWLPQFFIRTHGLTLQKIGMLFGPAATVGLLAGMLAGGWIGNRLAQQSLARPVITCVLANVFVVPLFLVVLWTSSLELALVLTFVAMALSAVWSPAYMSSIQNVCNANVRATGAAVGNVFTNLVGAGALPLLVGVISDRLFGAAGGDSLRWALTISMAFLLVAALLFLGALHAMRQQFDMRGARPA
ncbi:MFS transporter [Massilia cavernae]|uniref:MFS transporter n=1 Tax=Massilia cavernae TaxID=2320864 RepID=UPI001C71C3D3|nr:MFS transporter [Massilia cavernae]